MKTKHKNPPTILKKTLSRERGIKRYYLGESFPNIYFTLREMDVAALLIKHYTYQQIADALTLSARTIEYYTKQIRLKLHCDKKAASVRLLCEIDMVKQHKVTPT